MFAPTVTALVLATLLVASAQAYPGRDPLEEALPIRYGNSNLRANPTVCLIGKVFEVKNAIDEAKKDLPLILNVLPELNKNLAKCKENTDDPDFDWWDCELQAVRDTWEGTEKDRDTLKKGAIKILKAIQDILTCFKDDNKA